MTQDLKTIYIKEVENLSTRTKNCLVSARIITVQDLVDFCKIHGVNRISMFRNSGPSTVNEIDDFMTFLGLDTNISMQTDPKLLDVRDIPTFSTRTLNSLLCLEINTIQELLDYINKYGIDKIRQARNAGDKTIQEIRDFLFSYGVPLNTQKDKKIQNLELNTGTSIRATDRIFDIPTFSVRTLNTLKCLEIQTVQELLDYINKYGIDKIRQVRNAGDKTIQEIRDFLSSYGAPLDTQDKEQIRNLKSKISRYELVIAQLKNELAGLEKKKNTTNQQQKEQVR